MNKLVSPGGERRIPNNYGGFKHLLDSCVMLRLNYVLPLIERDFEVLDLGCGVGWQTKFISLYAKHVTGIDINASALDYARKHNGAANVSWLERPMNRLDDFNDSYFDLITSVASIEHLNQKDMTLIFKDLHRILKPGAHFVGTTTKFRDVSKANATRWHLFEPSIKDFSDMAKPYFSVIDIENFLVDTPDLKRKVVEGYFLFRNNTK